MLTIYPNCGIITRNEARKDNVMKNKKIFWGIMTMLWVVVIFSFSLQPGEVSGDISGSILHKVLGLFVPIDDWSQSQLELVHTILRKCAHFTEFVILGIFASLTMMHTKVRRWSLISLCFCVAIAAMDETLQLFVDGRAGRIMDVMIDSAGSMSGMLAVGLYAKIGKRKN